MAISPDFANDETLFVGTESGIFHSTNGGRAWREVDLAMDLAPVLSLAISPDYARDGTLLAGTESHGLFLSQDKGTTWRQVGAKAITEAVNAIVLSPSFSAQPDVLVLLGEALLISRNKGRSWSRRRARQWPERVAACVAAPQGLDPDAPLLVGFMGGDVARINWSMLASAVK